MKILHNHLGYPLAAPKLALLQASAAPPAGTFTVYDDETRQAVFGGPLRERGGVARWRDWLYWEIDFSPLRAAGRYFIALDGGQPPLQSQRFEVTAAPYDMQLLSDLLHYFKSQRCSGIFDRADRDCPLHGSGDRIDVHGGWYDASGDTSKYLSHLSYANFMNPQQAPQVVWNLIEGRARLPQQPLWMDERIVDEALHGADFLLRMQHPDGFFCTTVFDRWSKDVAQRRVCSYATQQGHLSARYQAGWRQGGGMAIAALARAGGLPRDGDHPRAAYLAAARTGFEHLQRHNPDYVDDGVENIIDDYCALLAATELLAATGEPRFRDAAQSRAARLVGRQHADGWFWADDARTRSFIHAAEAGLPFVALLRYLEVLPDDDGAHAVKQTLRLGLQHELSISARRDGNPFGYPRQRVRLPGGAERVQFFIPHHNDSGYWWQGENARLASLACAARAAMRVLPDEGGLAEYAQAALDWIFGCNPFDACMMQGRGHNAPRYESGYWNAPGGVCNGITSGLEDEDDIDFKRPQETTPMQSWRWSEQWMPHGAWVFLAVSISMQAPQALRPLLPPLGEGRDGGPQPNTPPPAGEGVTPASATSSAVSPAASPPAPSPCAP